MTGVLVACASGSQSQEACWTTQVLSPERLQIQPRQCSALHTLSWNSSFVAAASLVDVFEYLALMRQTADLSWALSKGVKHDRKVALQALREQSKHMTQQDFFEAPRASGAQSKRKHTCLLPLPVVTDVWGDPLSTFGSGQAKLFT